MLEGRLEVTVRDEHAELTSGATAYVSGNVPHTFRNPTGEPARFLLICSPGGMEQYFRGIATGDGELVAAVAERVGYREASAGLERDDRSCVGGDPAGIIDLGE